MERYKELYSKKWVKVQDLKEDLRLSDLMKHAGISDFTKPFKDDRVKIKGGGNTSAKLVSVDVDKTNDWVTYKFYSSPTYDFTAKVTDPSNEMKFKGNKPFYTQEIRILDFFKWADTKPGFQKAKELSTKELKEIFSVASIQVWCDDPSNWYQGHSYYLSLFNASIIKNDIQPEHWNHYHDENNLLCKHLSILLASINFWISPMASMLNKYFKENDI